MEVLRGMELTDTNRPRACFLQRCYASTVWFPRYGRGPGDTTPLWGLCAGYDTSQKCFGGHGERETPGSIPNPEVKPFSADGTAGGILWETRSLPDYLTPLGVSFGTHQGVFVIPRNLPGHRLGQLTLRVQHDYN